MAAFPFQQKLPSSASAFARGGGAGKPPADVVGARITRCHHRANTTQYNCQRRHQAIAIAVQDVSVIPPTLIACSAGLPDKMARWQDDKMASYLLIKAGASIRQHADDSDKKWPIAMCESSGITFFIF